MRKKLLAVMLLLVSTTAFAQGTMSIFQSGSYANILARHQGSPLLLVFWSLECTHCRDELRMLGELLVQQPELSVVLIATDSPQQRDALASVISDNGLQAAELWVFSEADSPRLRYEVDSHWYGELPRSYLFDAGHRRQALSGALKRATLDEWLAVNNNH